MESCLWIIQLRTIRRWGGLKQSDIKVIYAFIPTIQEYARVYPNPEQSKLNLMDDDELTQTAFWIYSSKTIDGDLNGVPHATEYWLDNLPSKLEETKLYKGWNFFANTYEVVGKSFNEIKGNCNIETVYGWDPEDQKWVGFSLDEDFFREIMGLGFVVKVSNNCKLGTSEGSVPSVPNLP